MANNNIVGELDERQTQIAYAQARTIADAAEVGTIRSNQFVFFAAFDGTRNDMKDVKLSGNSLDTNVAQLYQQADKMVKANPEGNLRTGYYRGHGTEGSLVASAWLPVKVTQETINTAQKAYEDFSRQASDWLKIHPNGEVTTAITSFSRGGATAAVFTHMLYRDGLIDPKTKEVLIPPGQVGVSAGVVFDPVTTGVEANVAFAPNVRNTVVPQAQNEYRSLFKAADYAGHAGMTTAPVTGNHCGIGGGYDNGLSALYLEAATIFLKKSGLAIADVDPSRRFDAKTPLMVYDESGTTKEMQNPLNQEQKRGQWDVYARFTSGTEYQPTRLLDDVAKPAQIKESIDGMVKDFTLYDKKHAIEIKDVNQEKARVYIEKSPEEALKLHPDLLGAFSFRTALLNDIAHRPIESQQVIAKAFDKVVVTNIEHGNLPLLAEMKYKANAVASQNVGAEA